MSPDDIEGLWSETIGLCKKLNIIYNIIPCNPEPQANGPECCSVHKRIILLNRFFLVHYLNQFTKSDWTNWSSSRLEQHRSTITQSKLFFWHAWQSLRLERAKVLAYLFLWCRFLLTHSALQLLHNNIKLNWGKCLTPTEEPDVWTLQMKVLMVFMVYVKRWANEDQFIHFICFRQVQHLLFTSLLVLWVYMTSLSDYVNESKIWTSWLNKQSKRTSSWKRIVFPHCPRRHR